MAVTAPLHVRDRLFVGGAWVEPTTTETSDVINPATEEVAGRIPLAGPADVDRAVAAAREALPAWAATPLAERQAVLGAVAAGLEARADELAALITTELGMPIAQSRTIQVGLPLATFATAPALAEEVPWRQEIGNSLVLREPVGVVGGITPWNYPLHQIAAKVAAALAVGCTFVLKPSEVTPLNAFVLAEIMEAAGVPPGVFNLVTGLGPVVGEALAAHPGVDMVSFTGSTRAGRRVSEVAAATVKPVALELGGKSANVLLDDADLVRAVPDGIQKAFLNSGQTCSALTRMLVPRERLAEAETIAAAVAEQTVVGDPFDPATHLGPLVSHAQRERVREYVRVAGEEGARLVAGGAEAPEGLDRGFYVRPTVFSEVDPASRLAQEEVFGPVLAILGYDDEDDAVRIANHSDFGLAGAVWSADEERALRVASRIRTGQVEINGGAFNPLAPFGGVKQSGHGREYGPWGMAEFTVVKAIQR
jgi:aldehyde dehydrogenase (NAD+)